MIELFIRLKEILNQMASGAHPLLDKMKSLKQMHLPRSAPLTQVEKSLQNVLAEKFFLSY
jgi:ATP-binding cassette subfamily A (ABC1) protein 12